MKYQVHYPKIGKVTIKVKNKIMKYIHNEIVEEQAFFARYPHIFKPRPDLELKVEPTKVETVIEAAQVAYAPLDLPDLPSEPEVEEVEEEPEEIKPVLVVEKISKGWYVVKDQNGKQVFPEEGKKTRKKKAESYIEENE